MVQSSDWVEIWDRASSVIKYHDSGISLHERLQKFLSEFSKLQNEAFAAQKKLCEKYIVDVEKLFGFDNTYGSVLNNFIQIVQRLVDTESLISGAFEIQANGDLKLAIENEKKRYKKWKHEREKLSSEMKSQTRIMDDEIKRYRDKFRDMLKAKEEYSKIEADKTHSHLDVEKAESNARLKALEFDRARKDYKAALNQFNLYRADYYSRTLSIWAHTGYQLEQDRFSRTQTLFNVLYERVRVATDRLNAVCSDLQSVSSGFDLDRDIEQLISRLRTGCPPPSDILFVDLAAARSGSIQKNDAMDTGSEQASTGPIYTSGSVVLPPNFYTSVSSADFAVLEAAGLLDPTTGGPIYAGTGSVYSAFSVNGIPAGSRRPSTSGGAPISTSPSGHGTALLRRFFSRRSRHDLTHLSCDYANSDGHNPDTTGFRRSERKTKRGLRSLRRKSSSRHPDKESVCRIRPAQSAGNLSVSNMKVVANAAGEAEYRQNCLNKTTQYRPCLTKQASINGCHNLLDSSDFSDTSFESDGDAPDPKAEGNPYAATSVLVGLNQTAVDNFSSPIQQEFREDTHSKRPNAAAPLAEPESLSLRPMYSHGSAIVPSADTTISNDSQGSTNQCINYTKTTQNRVKNSEVSTSIQPNSLISTNSPSNGSNLPPHGKLPTDSGKESGNHNGPASILSSAGPSADRRTSRLPMRPPPLALHKKLTMGNTSNLSDVPPGSSNFVTSTSPTGNPSNNVSDSSSHELTQLFVSDRRQFTNRKHYFARNPPTRSTFAQDTAVVVGSCTALYTFTAEGFESCYLPFEVGEKFYVLAPSPAEDTNDWLRVIRFQTYESGYVPTAYVEQQQYSQPLILPMTTQTDDDQSSQISNRTISVSSHPPRSPASGAQIQKGSRFHPPCYGRLPRTAKDTEL